MDQRPNMKTVQDTAPNSWKWVLIIFCVMVLVALTATGIFYYFRGRQENRQPPGVPQSMVWREGIKLSVNVGEFWSQVPTTFRSFAS
jgi:hypothetical protein